jgi:uncharacterized FlgJ-related protein
MSKTKDKKITKISNEHLSELQNLVSTANKISMGIGGIEAQKFAMLKELEVIDGKLMILQVALEENYGTSNVNITDGTIISDEQVN